MQNKKTKEHFVPQCYLEAWAINNKHQISVYNKKNKKSYIANISDVAAERYFYDINWSDLFKEKFGLPQDPIATTCQDQSMENWFASSVENELKTILKRIICKVQSMNDWELENCFFISEKCKCIFSSQLAIQFLRTKAVRESLSGIGNCISQVLNEMGVPQRIIDNYSLSKNETSLLHAQLFHKKEFKLIIKAFFEKTWILLVNRTNHAFFTSDNPISLIENKKHPNLLGSGLKSDGIEISFPVSPDLLLVMFDKKHFEKIANRDRRIRTINNPNIIKHYNLYTIGGNSSCVFSNSNSFSFVDEILKVNPSAFDYSDVVVTWNNKVYTPQ